MSTTNSNQEEISTLMSDLDNIQAIILSVTPPSEYTVPARLKTAWDVILEAGSTIPASELAKDVGISRKTIVSMQDRRAFIVAAGGDLSDFPTYQSACRGKKLKALQDAHQVTREAAKRDADAAVVTKPRNRLRLRREGHEERVPVRQSIKHDRVRSRSSSSSAQT